MASIHGNLNGDVPAFLSPLFNGAPKLSAMISTNSISTGEEGFKRRGYMRTALHNHPQATEKAVDYGTLPYNLSSVPCKRCASAALRLATYGSYCCDDETRGDGDTNDSRVKGGFAAGRIT